MFSIGDCIVHPMHGAGFIEDIELKTIGNEQREYYAVHIPCGNIHLMFPAANNGAVRLRAVITKGQAEEVLQHFRKFEVETDAPWGKRYKENMDRLKSGVPEDVAEVVKALMVRDKSVGLSTGDRQVMVMAKNILCSELSVAMDCEMETVLGELQQVIDHMIG